MTTRAIGFGKRLAAVNSAALTPAADIADPSSINELSQRTNRNSFSDEAKQLYGCVFPKLDKVIERTVAKASTRGVLAKILTELCDEAIVVEKIAATEDDVRNSITRLLNDWIVKLGGIEASSLTIMAPTTDAQNEKGDRAASQAKKTILDAKTRVFPLLIEHVDASAMVELTRGELAEQISEIATEILVQERIHLNTGEQRDLITLLLNDMLGLGPLEPLLADDSITDIMINGPRTIFIERKGKLELTDVQFRDEMHLLNIAQRIVSAVGRRVDESSPICDARLADGSRVNVIIPPLAIDGTTISIRKFSRSKITLESMVERGNITEKMCRLLQIAGRIRLNIIISGGTGSGKTTMLNAISRCIDPGERVVTIEDAAELQLQQTHVVRLETRPSNIEGNGEVNMRDLVKNALRMRPDRIILGEVRGPEAVDLLAAMNTGHDGSLGTLHANRPREAITRLENMVNMAGLNLPPKAIRTQIADAVHLVIQVSRMRDGIRRITHITEVIGMEGDVVVSQDLYLYKYNGEDDSGNLRGEYESTGLRPKFFDRAEYYGLGRALMECM
jgi:pilus assembly protein CpaF